MKKVWGYTKRWRIITVSQGDLTKAKKCHEESLALRLEVGKPWDIAQTFGNLFSLSMMKNDHKSAREFAEKALDLFQQAGDQRGVARIRVDLAWIDQAEGDYPSAIELLTKALSQLVQFDDNWSCAELIEGLSSLSYEQGNLKRAAILFGAAEVLRENVGMPLQGFEHDFFEKDLTAFWNDIGKKEFVHAWPQDRAMTLEQVVEFLLHEPESPSTVQAEKERVGGLTRRERETAVLIAQGMSNREIAEAMTVTEKTVEAYVTRILRKLGAQAPL